jgi:galactokinase
VVWALRDTGQPVRGGTLSITSDVEMGSGLASSAALECAVLGALAADTRAEIDLVEQARIAQRAENEYVGAPTGLLDQLAALLGEPRRALLIDFRDVTVRPVPFDPNARNVVLLVINSRAQHRRLVILTSPRRARSSRRPTLRCVTTSESPPNTST